MVPEPANGVGGDGGSGEGGGGGGEGSTAWEWEEEAAAEQAAGGWGWGEQLGGPQWGPDWLMGGHALQVLPQSCPPPAPSLTRASGRLPSWHVRGGLPTSIHPCIRPSSLPFYLRTRSRSPRCLFLFLCA
jgi:hypothetical protein